MVNSRKKGNVDWILLSTSSALSVFGLVFVYTLSSSYSERLFDHPFFYIHKHITGFALALVASVFVYRNWSAIFVQKYAIWFFIISVTLIISTLFSSTGWTVNGASRWIDLGFTNLFVLPIATLSLLLSFSAYLAGYFSNNKFRSRHSLVIVLVTLILVMLLNKQPDFGGAVVLFSLIIALCFISRLYKLSAFLFAVIILFTITSIIYEPYRTARIAGYLHPFDNMFSTGYQLSISLSAIGGGDFWGAGFGEGLLNREKFPGAFEDFAFASIIEEFGFIGALVLLLGLGIFFWRCLKIGFQLLNSERKFEALLVLGITSWILLIGMLHMASNLGLVPTIYMPFPFISYGPSYLFSFIIGIALIARISADSTPVDAPQSIPKKVVVGVLLLFSGVGCSTFSKAVLDEGLDQHYRNRVNYIKHAINKDRNFKKLEASYRRGRILDRHGKILAKYVPAFDIWINPKEWDQDHPDWESLIALLYLDRKNVNHKLVTSKKLKKSFIYLKRHINVDVAEQVRKLNVPGVNLSRGYTRHYPGGEAIAQVVGFTDADDNGLTGSEFQFNKLLRPKLNSSYPNRNVQLSIDLRIQEIAYQVLLEGIQKSQASAGSAIVVNAGTGEVLAMVNAPSYDPGNLQASLPDRIKNRVITDTIEPGDTFIPFTILAALESGKYSPNSLIDTGAGYLINDDYRILDDRPFGKITLGTILRKSSRVGASKIALDLPIGKLESLLGKLGFLQATNIEAPGEKLGSLNSQNGSIETNIAFLSQGLGMTVTPLQLVKAYSIIANNGSMVPLTLLKKKEPPKSARIIPSLVNAQLKHMLQANSNYQLIGKQGLVKKGFFSPTSTTIENGIYAGMNLINDNPISIVVVINNLEPSLTTQAITSYSSKDIATSIYEQSAKLISDR